MISRIAWWIQVRKNTTPVHWLFGFLCDFIVLSFGILAGWGMMAMFAGLEWWNDYCDGTKHGCADWWESFITFCIGFGVLALLNYLGVITIRWC